MLLVSEQTKSTTNISKNVGQKPRQNETGSEKEEKKNCHQAEVIGKLSNLIIQSGRTFFSHENHENTIFIEIVINRVYIAKTRMMMMIIKIGFGKQIRRDVIFDANPNQPINLFKQTKKKKTKEREKIKLKHLTQFIYIKWV